MAGLTIKGLHSTIELLEWGHIFADFLGKKFLSLTANKCAKMFVL